MYLLTSRNYEIPVRASVKLSNDPKNNNLALNLQDRKFEQQYASIYFTRLASLKAATKRAASLSWDSLKIDGRSIHYVEKALNIPEGELVWIVGTIYKEMKFKPSIFEDVASAHYGPAPVVKERYTDPGTDVVMLEDESGRIKLTGNKIRSMPLVTGIIAAILGSEDSEGDFRVIDVRFPDYAPQKLFPTVVPQKRYIALISGLCLSPSDKFEREQLLLEFLIGELGGSPLRQLSAEICHVILAGDSLADQNPNKGNLLSFGTEAHKFDFEPMTRLDEFIYQVCQSVPLSLLPGQEDPVEASMPQQPFHRALFRKSAVLLKEGVFTTTTNPYWWDIEGRSVLGSGGQTINDIYRYLEEDDRLEMMKNTLKWRHCAPTAPDTLWCYPFPDTDPFILNETPHIYFVGSQPKFATRLVEDVGIDGYNVKYRLIMVPRYSETGQIVLVDIDTLETRLVEIAR